MTNSNTYYSEGELKKILDIDQDNNRVIFMPNKIFFDLVNCDYFKDRKANATHIAFAFSYLYLASYMYRYAHFQYSEKYTDTKWIDDKIMYKICNTSPDSRGANGKSYITKKNGVLVSLRYLRKESDYPIRYYYPEDNLGNKDFTSPQFSMFSKLIENDALPSDYQREANAKKVNFPVRAFYKDEVSEMENYEDGYFYFPQYTTRIDINIFIWCMARSDLGVIGFYLYSFLKSKCDYFGGNYSSPIDSLVDATGIKSTKLCETLTTLEEYNMITNTHSTFITDLSPDKRVPANTYKVLPYDKFIRQKQTVERRQVVRQVTYDALHRKYLGQSNLNHDDEYDDMDDLSSYIR
ncbi:hypothetical protein ASG89_31965 [Paenibacillus sp. Soil766]|uniref:hypothetical protein n=1 Tax=Paenibacillus sp. Soil766 TaxID=1736404 RepID=UPI00070BA396|nr:hypothetical protein [Paenibacillus sp. Soil766]KRE94909.1 hypothetical protein ASG89_31965 [Paenibacillus sp. Soil766]